MRGLATCAVLLALLILGGGSAAASVPLILDYQGYATDELGQPLEAPLPATFELFPAQTGGTSFWSVTKTLDPVEGVLSTTLGDTALGDPALSAADLDQAEVWLQVTLGGEVLVPRQRVVAVAYAVRAADAESLEGQGVAEIVAQARAGVVIDGGNQVNFDSGDESIEFDTGEARFEVSDALRVWGPLHAGGSGDLNVYGFSALSGSATAAPESGELSTADDLWIASDLEIGGSLLLNRPLIMEASNASGVDREAEGHPQRIYFYRKGVQPSPRGAEYFGYVNDTPTGTFQFTENISVGSHSVPANVDYNFFGSDGAALPESTYMSGRGDIFASDDLEVADELYVGSGGRISTPVIVIRGGADLSEKFGVRAGPADAAENAAAEEGDVVCVDPESAGGLRVCDRAYDRTVAGIVAGAGGVGSGMVMSQEGSLADGQVPVALMGRVYAKADARDEPIRPGDLLTTSARRGHLARASDLAKAQGAVLGKALTGLEQGSGLVLVLVSLQ